MYFGDTLRSPGKPFHCIDKSCLDLKITSVEYGQLHFQINVSEFESNSESESGGIFAFLPNIQYLKNGNCNSNLKIRVTWKFRCFRWTGMLSMVCGKKIRVTVVSPAIPEV